MPKDYQVEKILKEYFESKCVNISEVANKTGISRDKLAKSMMFVRRLKANEFITIVVAMKIPFRIFTKKCAKISTKEV